MAPPTPQTAVRSGRNLIDHALRERLATRISNDHGFPWAYCARIVDQTAVFLAGCAVSDRPLSPSKRVDIGWHTFILYTAEYTAFCKRIAGRYIHHRPLDDGGSSEGTAMSPEKTAEFLASQGFEVDRWLWLDVAQGPEEPDCKQCCRGDYDHSDDT
ncbi:hypothetical protein GCM10027294_54120 [Marinactinospora endophytica]